MIDDDYQPEGEIKKDYMAFSELLDRNPRMEIINCLRYVLMKSPPNYELPVDDDAIVIESKRMPIDDFNELDAEEIEKMETDLHVRNPRVRFNHADMVALSKAIAHFSFNFISLKLVNCGLSRRSLTVLGKGLSHQKSLRILCIEMNSFLDTYDEIDQVLSSHPRVRAMEDSVIVSTPSVEQAKKRREEELKQLQYQVTLKRKDNVKKKSEQTSDQDKNQRAMENRIIFETYMSNSLGALFLTSAKHISLRGCELGDDDADVIAKILSENNEIISLNLWGNNITDRGGIAIARSLRTNRTLNSISLAMNKISDVTIQEICSVLSKGSLFTEEEFFDVRDKVFKSTFGTMNIPRDPKTFQLVLPALPVHLCSVAERKKAEKTKKPSKPSASGNSLMGDGPIEWEQNVQRLDEEAPPPPKKNPKTSSRPTTARNDSTEPPKPLFTIPGNEVLRSFNLSSNVMITDKGAGLFLNLPYIPLERLNLSYCTVSNTMFHSIIQKMNQPEEYLSPGTTPTDIPA